MTEIVLQAPDKLGACAVGDFDPDSPGEEIATVCRTGELFVVSTQGANRVVRSVYQTPGEMIQLAVGDARPDLGGLEIVAVGSAEGEESDHAPGAAWVFTREGRDWSASAAFESPKLLHAVTVNAGNLLVAGYDLDLTALQHDGRQWHGRKLGRLPGPGKCAVTSGGVSYLACKDGSVIAARPPVASGSDEGWMLDVFHRRSAPRARLDGDADRVLVCDDDGVLSLVGLDGMGEVVYRENDKLRGAVLADLDPTVPGPEIATVGYERRLTILSKLGGTWTATPVLLETEKFHGLASGDLDGDGDDELVACGYSGRLIVVDHFERHGNAGR